MHLFLRFIFGIIFVKFQYDVYHFCVYSEKTPDDGQRNCPKHVQFYSKNKFEKLVHLVGFIGDRGSTMVKVLCYKSEGRWFDPS